MNTQGPTHRSTCRGLAGWSINRRAFLNTTVAAGGAGVALPQLLAARASARQAGRPVHDTAVIQIWLGGGPSQFETYDPKPDAPVEYRGSFGAIATRLPGVQICEVLPRHAQMLDRVAILRSVYHNSGDHDAGMYFCVTGKATKFQPSTGSITARVRERQHAGLAGLRASRLSARDEPGLRPELPLRLPGRRLRPVLSHRRSGGPQVPSAEPATGRRHDHRPARAIAALYLRISIGCGGKAIARARCRRSINSIARLTRW